MDNNVQKKMFLYYFMKLRNIREAALRAGFSDREAFSEGMRILVSSGFSKKLKNADEKTNCAQGLVKAGLERLAFGEINDAVKLVFAEENLSEKEISCLDLFNVSEIKRVKGGGLEIKLFDRQKALEKLWEIENTADINSSAESFFNAIREGAQAVTGKNMGDE